MSINDTPPHSSEFRLDKDVNYSPQQAKSNSSDSPFSASAFDEQEMCDSIRQLCDELSQPSCSFSFTSWNIKLERYLEKYKRILYSEISTFIFNLNDDDFGTVSTNLGFCINALRESVRVEQTKATPPITQNLTPQECAQTEVVSQTESAAITDNIYANNTAYISCIQKKIAETPDRSGLFLATLKFKDHIELAHRQKTLFYDSDSKLKQQIDSRILSTSCQMTKELTNQFIGLIAVFTALSFVIFGAINSLASIFTALNNGILSSLTVSLCWALCMANLLFVFVYFILRIIQKVDLDPQKNIVQQFPMVFLVNYILIFLLTVCGVLILLRHYDSWIAHLSTIWTSPKWANALLAIILIAIAGGFIFIAYKLVTKYNETP